MGNPVYEKRKQLAQSLTLRNQILATSVRRGSQVAVAQSDFEQAAMGKARQGLGQDRGQPTEQNTPGWNARLQSGLEQRGMLPGEGAAELRAQGILPALPADTTHKDFVAARNEAFAPRQTERQQIEQAPAVQALDPATGKPINETVRGRSADRFDEIRAANRERSLERQAQPRDPVNTAAIAAERKRDSDSRARALFARNEQFRQDRQAKKDEKRRRKGMSPQERLVDTQNKGRVAVEEARGAAAAKAQRAQIESDERISAGKNRTTINVSRVTTMQRKLDAAIAKKAKHEKAWRIEQAASTKDPDKSKGDAWRTENQAGADEARKEIASLKSQIDKLSGTQKLTPEMAAELMEEAGDDRDAARKLARERGFTF